MGITIHFKGSLTDPGILNKLVTEVEDICKIMHWKYRVLDDSWTEPVDARIAGKDEALNIEGNLGLKGISFQPHEQSEWVNLYFDRNGTLTSIISKISQIQNQSHEHSESWNFVKTQFAPVKTHIAIIKLLRHLKKNFIHDLEVSDEGEYWNTDNPEILSSHFGSISKSMDLVEKKLENAQLVSPEEKMSTEEYADYIAHLLENSSLETEIKLRGGEMWKSENIDPYADNQFMKDMLAFEEAENGPQIPILSLFPADYKFPSAESMTDSEVDLKLNEIGDILSTHHIEFGFDNELPDKVLYKYLTDYIHKETISELVTSGTWVLDGCSGDCESCFQKEFCSTAKEQDL